MSEAPGMEEKISRGFGIGTYSHLPQHHSCEISRMRLMTRAGVDQPTYFFAQVPHCSGEQEHRDLGRTCVPPQPSFCSSSPACETPDLDV